MTCPGPFKPLATAPGTSCTSACIGRKLVLYGQSCVCTVIQSANRWVLSAVAPVERQTSGKARNCGFAYCDLGSHTAGNSIKSRPSELCPHTISIGTLTGPFLALLAAKCMGLDFIASGINAQMHVFGKHAS